MTKLPIPTIDGLQVDEYARPILDAIRQGDKAYLDQLKVTQRIPTKQLGELTITQALALYAPWSLVEAYAPALTGDFTDFGELLGKKWKGFSGPTALLTLFNPHPQVTAEIFAQAEGELSRQLGYEDDPKKDGVYTSTLQGVINHLWYGKDLPVRWESHKQPQSRINNLSFGVLTYLCQATQHSDDKYSRLIAEYCGIHSEYGYWETFPLRGDDRLLPLYPKIRDAVTTVLNEVDQDIQAAVAQWLQKQISTAKTQRTPRS